MGEAGQLVGELVARRDDQHRRRRAQLVAQAAQEGQAVESRQADVEQDDVEAIDAAPVQRGLAAVDRVDLEAAQRQEGVEVARDAEVVLDDQDARARGRRQRRGVACGLRPRASSPSPAFPGGVALDHGAMLVRRAPAAPADGPCGPGVGTASLLFFL